VDRWTRSQAIGEGAGQGREQNFGKPLCVWVRPSAALGFSVRFTVFHHAQNGRQPKWGNSNQASAVRSCRRPGGGAQTLRAPVLGVVAWPCRMLWTAVPETAVDVDRDLRPRDTRSARRRVPCRGWPVGVEPQAHPVCHRVERSFRSGVPSMCDRHATAHYVGERDRPYGGHGVNPSPGHGCGRRAGRVGPCPTEARSSSADRAAQRFRSPARCPSTWPVRRGPVAKFA